jgi:hypothetical protein
MLWKRLAPLVLAVTVTAVASAAASRENRGQTTFFDPAGCSVEKNVVCPRFSPRAL